MGEMRWFIPGTDVRMAIQLDEKLGVGVVSAGVERALPVSGNLGRMLSREEQGQFFRRRGFLPGSFGSCGTGGHGMDGVVDWTPYQGFR